MNAVDRFLKYVTFDTTSDENSESCPSSEKQFALADYLVEEMKQIGIADAMRDDNCYVYGHIPATKGCENLPKIGFIAHMDTCPDVSGTNVVPRIITFDGTNAPLIDNKYMGQELIVTEGDTLLGSDDKAGIAEIMASCEEIINNKNIRHGAISIGFTPDEEIGRGADLFDIEKFNADFAYTVDGCELGEIENENFNAAGCKITVNGVNTHPGSAKNKMKNSILYATELVTMLPYGEIPSCTENREGFFHVNGIEGDETKTVVKMIIRDHDKNKFEEKKKYISELCDFLNKKYGENTFVSEIKDSYYNMREIIDKYPEIVSLAIDAMKKADVEPVICPIRGGTDGARLSFEGLPCPNLSTGGMAIHSIHEAIPVNALLKMTEVIINIISHH